MFLTLNFFEDVIGWVINVKFRGERLLAEIRSDRNIEEYFVIDCEISRLVGVDGVEETGYLHGNGGLAGKSCR